MGWMLRKWQVFGMGKSDLDARGIFFLPSLESTQWKCKLALHELDAYKVAVADTFASG